MPRIYADTTLDQVAYAKTSNATMVNLAHGANMGPSIDFRNFVSNTAYVRRHVIPFLIESPRGFQDLDRPDIWVAALKSLIEVWPMAIDGLAAGVTVEVTETAAGGAGEMQQDPTNVTRARTEISYRWKERYGSCVQKFLEGWVTYLIMDPNTKYPRVVALGVRPPDLLPDYYGCTVLFVEPDPTGLTVIRSWLCTNVYPMDGITAQGSRDITQPMQEEEYTIRMASLSQVGEGVDNFAQLMLNSLNFSGLNSGTQQAFVQAVDADVTASATGWGSFLDNLAATQVQAPVNQF
jgi:hypothetical protein